MNEGLIYKNDSMRRCKSLPKMERMMWFPGQVPKKSVQSMISLFFHGTLGNHYE